MGDWIRAKYVELADSIRFGKCLKTDCWNEAEDFNPIKADDYLEIDEARCNKARGRGYNVTVGDVTKMPFNPNAFECIFDCSTIDHVKDYEEALKEYHRCLTPDGKILIVVWVTPNVTIVVDTDGWGSKQYWFNQSKFKSDFEKYFTTKQEGLIHQQANDRLLWYYIGDKHE
jgi:ubiquinone/menaquinone biosynthesis C-methylase UbiE